MLVSIVMASYNKAALINETIRSVLAQTHTNWELVIVDDASNDGTVDQIQSSFNDVRIRLLVNPENKGANYGRNLGIRTACGEYIMFLDADDLLAETCIERRLAAAKAQPGKNLLVFTMGVFYKRPGDDSREWKPESVNPLEDFLQHKLPWSILQPFWKRDFLLALGGFDEAFLRLQDVELNTRALLSTEVRLFVVGGAADCYYRIDEERKNYDPFRFLERWVDSSNAYCNKFYVQLNANKRNYLFGTFFETYLQLMYHFKTAIISGEQFKVLENRLLSGLTRMPVSGMRRTLLYLARVNNMGRLKLPGLNRVLKMGLMLG